MSQQEKGKFLHYRIAERGKMHAMRHDHKEALRHYREAIRMCTAEGAPEIFFQHYTQCVMESLERSNAHDEVLSYCDKTLTLLESKVESSDFIRKNYATTMEKKGIQFLLKGEKENAITSFKRVQEVIGRGKQPLTDEVLNWMLRGYQISDKQIENTQKKYNYFTVRKDTINESIAMDLPKSVMPL